MPLLSHPDVVVASVGCLVDDDEIVPHDLNVEDDEVLGEVFQDSSSDKWESLFSLALYLQR